MKQTISKSFADVEFGKEPRGVDFRELSVGKQIEAFNYYNYRFNPKYAKEVLAKIIPEVEWFDVRAIEFSATYAWMFMLEKRECILPEEMIAKRTKFIEECRAKYPKSKTKPVEIVETKVVDTIPDNKWLADFDDIDDTFWKSFNLIECVDKVKVLVSTLKHKYQSASIRDRCLVMCDELDAIPKDAQVKQAYAPYNSSNIRVAKKFYTTIAEHINYSTEVKRVIKPRKKKEIPLEKKMKFFQYQTNSEEFKLVSIAPEKMIGSNIVWTFNTKTRDLSVLESTEGFDVKGTTLINGNSSKVRKVRKTEMLKDFVSTKIKMMKDFNALKVTERNGNYRINKDTILLKVF